MTKTLLCAGEKTNLILEKLEYNVGGIELLGCNFTTDLEKKIGTAGRLSKVIIFETGIKDGFIPDIIMSPEYEIVLVLNNQELMQQCDIDYVGFTHIQIVDARGQKITTIFIKDLISASKIEDYLLYKSNNLTSNDFEEVEETEETHKVIEDKPIQRAVEVEDEPVQDQGPKLINNQSGFEIERPTIQREVSLEKEEEIKVAPKIMPSKNPNNDIQRIISLYKGGCILAFTGTPKCYTSTTAYNIGKYLAKIGITTCLIDLDFTNYSLGVLNKTLFNQTQMSTSNNVMDALQSKNILNTAFLVQDNFFVLTAPVIEQRLGFTETNLNFLKDLIEVVKQTFKVVILDFQLKDINILHDIVMNTTKVIMNIGGNNKDYLTIMRTIETLDDDKELRNKLFTDSCYLNVNDNNKKKLNTSAKDLRAIDLFLESKEYINELKYEYIPNAGSIMFNKDFNDYMENSIKTNESEVRNTILRIFGERE